MLKLKRKDIDARTCYTAHQNANIRSAFLKVQMMLIWLEQEVKDLIAMVVELNMASAHVACS